MKSFCYTAIAVSAFALGWINSPSPAGAFEKEVTSEAGEFAGGAAGAIVGAAVGAAVGGPGGAIVGGAIGGYVGAKGGREIGEGAGTALESARRSSESFGSGKTREKYNAPVNFD